MSFTLAQYRDADKSAVLRAADVYLRSLREHRLQGEFTCLNLRFKVAFDYPGVVRVYRPFDGEFVCESVPGNPTELAMASK